MTLSTHQVLQDALALPPAERATLIDELFLSLDKPDPTTTEQWAKEAEDRLHAYRAGELLSIPEEDVHQEFEHLISTNA